ncbi:CidA/LrgA family protein [Sandarakinorhabdus sp. DWP1-3-1]|uniref:CidA/LrgA family protein n=1 Tax=Sandarakinorhabdus sp. DWP1-3-1 TaxID=2804627 RepID=UPI003CE98AE3
MRNSIEIGAGALLCIALAMAGDALVAALRLPVPGAIIGLVVYLGWLTIGRGIGWSRRGAALLIRWIGAMIVPALVGLQAYAGALAGTALPLALLLVVTTLLTALATALLYRAAGGRG